MIELLRAIEACNVIISLYASQLLEYKGMSGEEVAALNEEYDKYVGYKYSLIQELKKNEDFISILNSVIEKNEGIQR